MKAAQPDIRELRHLLKGRVRANHPLSRCSTFRIGGPAAAIAEPADSDELAGLLAYSRERGIPRLLVGAGSNVLFPDAGFRGVVIRLRGLNSSSAPDRIDDHVVWRVGAGLALPALIALAFRAGLTGLEPLWGIPGTVGGAVATNAGAGGTSVSDRIDRVGLITAQGEYTELKRGEWHYEYRKVVLPEGSTVVDATFRLPRGHKDTMRASLERARAHRRATQPWRQPSAGCVFKNPDAEHPAGLLIDRLGCKGLRIGGAQVSDIHANFIVNLGNARADDVRRLMDRISERVFQAESIRLEPEIRIIDEEFPDA